MSDEEDEMIIMPQKNKIDKSCFSSRSKNDLNSPSPSPSPSAPPADQSHHLHDPDLHLSNNQHPPPLLDHDKDDDIIRKVKDPSKKQTKKAKKKDQRLTRKGWITFVNLLTCCLPSKLLLYIFKGNYQVAIAFREKLVWNFLILVLSFLFFFLVVGVGWIICPQAGKVLNEYEVNALSTKSYPLVIAYGYFYLIKDVYKDHVVSAGYLSSGAFEATVLGYDVSPMFVKVDSFSDYCPGLPPPPDGWDNIKRVIPEKAMTVWMIHSSQTNTGKPKNYLKLIDHDKKGPVARDKSWIQSFLLADPLSNRLVVAYGRVYDVSQYLVGISSDFPTFLGPNILQIIQQAGRTGQDLTNALEQVKQKEGVAKWRMYMNCMDAMFFVGVQDQRGSIGCQTASYIVLVASILIVVIIGVKFLAALQFSMAPSPQPPRRFVLITVPCYNEGAESLYNTFSSVAATKYESGMRVLFVCVDGVVKGKENDQFTSDIVLQVLGHPSASSSSKPFHSDFSVSENQTVSQYSMADKPHLSSPIRMYHSLGDGPLQINMARVYSGVFRSQGNSLPYIIVVKTGELSNNGNRGKRDSQLLVLSFLSRLHLGKELCPLDLELQYHFLYCIGIDAKAFEFLLWVDGDTELDPESISLFVSSMENDGMVSGICGETVLRNPSQSWVTMIQVYEYWITHNLAKSFESIFGSVTCLPGCFSMYRLFSASDGTLVAISDRIIEEFGLRKVDTLHLKNLLSLGEDRYLTTLCLKNFPHMKTKFISSAIAKTSAPDLWKVLLSQRRRWINSTIHNLLELLLLSQLKGFFLFSIKFIVFMDLLSTLLSPVGFIYFIYLLVVLFSQVVIQIPLVSILLLCAIYGLQVLLFLFKRQFAHIGWMVLYLLAMPLYTFILPLYSFWKMDDFSWGSTRLVQDEDSDVVFSFGDGDGVMEQEHFEESCIPKKTWRQFESDGGLALRIAFDVE